MPASLGAWNAEEPSSGAADFTIIPVPFQTSASSPAKPSDRDEGARLPSSMQLETLGPSMQLETLGRLSPTNASVDVLAEQMLTLVEVVSAQDKDIKALKAQNQQLEEHEQAIMVAFTTFFHVLAAKRIARLRDISAILHNIINVAEREAQPPGSIQLLERLATMLQKQSGAGTAEVQVDGRRGSEPDAAPAQGAGEC
jgi:hypothetical protein